MAKTSGFAFTDEYKGHVVAVTGVGRAGQVGEAIAAHFADAGASLALLDLDREQLVARADELRERHPHTTISAHACNLTDADSAAAAVAEVHAAHGELIHALVNAAGGFGMDGVVADSNPQLLQRMLAVNLTTAFTATRAFLPSLRSARGALCYFGSVAALPGGSGPRMAAYAASKAAVLSLMASVAEEERKHGVRANAVVPTAVRTAMNEESMGTDAEYVERDDVARLVLWLCSPLTARVITGQAIRAG